MYKLISTFALLCAMTLAADSSPAELRIAAATKLIRTGPKTSQAYNDLAIAYCRRARETGDGAYFNEAEEALARSVQLAPGNYDAEKIRVTILLGEHQFPEALKRATELNRRVPDDVAVWGLLADADIGLGDYAAAEKATQWMLDLRPGNVPGFMQAARLRELFGDIEGAIEFMDEALRRTSQNETEERAWLLAGTARLNELKGNRKRADELLTQALKLYPDYHVALAELAILRMSEAKYAEAIELLERRYKLVPNAENLYDLADGLERSGRTQEAEAAFRRFEVQAKAETIKPNNANIDLIFYYADRRVDPAAALLLAGREIATRHDVRTLDAYAWALYRNRKYKDAQAQMQTALSVGVLDPVFLCHASQIAAMAGDGAQADKYREASLSMRAAGCAANAQSHLSGATSR